MLFWRDHVAEPLSADCDGSAESAADIAGADPAADLLKGSAKPSLLSPTVNTVAILIEQPQNFYLYLSTPEHGPTEQEHQKRPR